MSLWDGFKIMSSACVDAIFPRTCRVCGTSLTVGERLLCLKCMSELPRTGLHLVDFNTIHQRVGGVNPIEMAAGWFYYYSDSPYARLIREAKYDDRPRTARVLGQLYGAELAAEGFRDAFDLLLPVALHRDKLLKRGYNQSREIALGIASRLGCEVGDNLVAVKTHKTQTRKGAFERSRNVAGTFEVRYGGELDGKRVAIVDDVITTGATMLDCVDALYRACTPLSVNLLSIGVTKLR